MREQGGRQGLELESHLAAPTQERDAAPIGSSLATAPSHARGCRVGWTAVFNGIGEAAEQLAQVPVLDCVRHAASFLAGIENPRALEHLQVSRDDREVDRAALGDLAHGTSSPTLRQAPQQLGAGRIAERLKQARVEKVVNRAAAGGSLLGRHRPISAYLRHYASIARHTALSTHESSQSGSPQCKPFGCTMDSGPLDSGQQELTIAGPNGLAVGLAHGIDHDKDGPNSQDSLPRAWVAIYREHKELLIPPARARCLARRSSPTAAHHANSPRPVSPSGSFA